MHGANTQTAVRAGDLLITHDEIIDLSTVAIIQFYDGDYHHSPSIMTHSGSSIPVSEERAFSIADHWAEWKKEEKGMGSTRKDYMAAQNHIQAVKKWRSENASS